MLSQKRLKELLSYDPDTGVFVRRVRVANRHEGDAAGCVQKNGYHGISIDNRLYYSHRLAWLYVHGETPKKSIDHIDGNKTNNRLANLRLATYSENSMNSKMRADNSSGFKGVSWDASRRGWCAYLDAGGKRIKRGYFWNKYMAAQYRALWEVEFHKDFAYGGA